MASPKGTKTGSTFPLAATIWIGVLGAIVSGASFEIIKHWPLPVSVAPYFGWKIGGLWGLVVGGISGLILGFLTDETHFDSAN